MNDLRTRIAWIAYFILVTTALAISAVLALVGGGDL